MYSEQVTDQVDENSLKRLAAFFYLRDNSEEDITTFKKNVNKFVNAFCLVMMKGIRDSNTAEDYQYHAFEAAKSYGNVGEFFKRVYQLLFNTDSGPKIGVFIDLFGKEEFFELVLNRVDNPLNLP